VFKQDQYQQLKVIIILRRHLLVLIPVFLAMNYRTSAAMGKS